MADSPLQPVDFTNENWQRLFKSRSLSHCMQVTADENPSSLWSPYQSIDLSKFKEGTDFNFTTPNISGEIKEVSTFSKIVNTYSKSGYEMTSANLGVPGIGSANFEQESKHSSTSKFESTDYFSTVMYRVPKVRIVFDKDEFVLGEKFMAKLNKALSADNKQDQYTNLIQHLKDYGYYLPTDVILGGLYFASKSKKVTSTEEAKEFSKSMKAGFEADLSSFDIPVKGGASGGTGSTSGSSHSNSHTHESLTIQVIGGDPSKRKDYEEWTASLATSIDEWHIININQMEPVINFIPDQQTRFKIASLFQMFPDSSYSTNYFQKILDEQMAQLGD